MKKILVSACLYGEHVRYDGGDVPCLDERFLQWKKEGRLVPICPEVFGGLPIPRPDSQRVGDKVLTRTGRDVSKEYESGALESVRLAKEHDVAFAIMKQNSPSCGSKFIYDGTFTNTKISGEGRTTELLRKAGIMVFDEKEIDEAEKQLRVVEDHSD